MSASYVVRVQYRVDDGLSPAVDKMADKASKTRAHTKGASDAASELASSFSRMGSVVTGVFDSIVSGAMAGGSAMAVMAAAGAAKMIKTGISVNAAVEDSTIAFQSIFNTFGVVDSFEKGLSPARELIAGIRQDAKMLPGEFQDFVDMAQVIGPSLFGAGKSVADIRKQTSMLAVAAAAVGMKGKGGFEQAAREYAELVEGRAGTHNKLGLKYGIDSHTKVGNVEFNKASKDARLKFVEERMGKSSKGALSAYEGSWSGMTSSLSDNLKASMGRITAPLMDRLKDAMLRAGRFGDKHKDAVGNIEDWAAKSLVSAYDYVEGKVNSIVDNWKKIRDFANETRSAIGKAYEFAKPVIDAGKSAASAMFEDPQKALTQVIALRAGAGLVSSGVAGEAMAATGGAAAIPAAAVGIALIDDVGGSVQRLTDTVMGWGQTITDVFGVLFVKGGLVRDVLGALGAVIIQSIDWALLPFKLQIDAVTGIIKVANDAWAWLKETLFGVGGALSGVSDAFWHFWYEAKEIANKIRNIFKSSSDGNGEGESNAMVRGGITSALRAMENEKVGAGAFEYLKNAFSFSGESKDSKTLSDLKSNIKSMGGKGGTTVNVNAPLTVLTDSDPDRLAKGVAVHIKSTLQAPTRAMGLRTYLDG